MADLPFRLQSLVHILGCIGIALGVEHDKTGLWTFVVPAITAVVILGASWGFRYLFKFDDICYSVFLIGEFCFRSYRMKMVAPRKRYWLVHFLPGFCFAAIGLALFAAVVHQISLIFIFFPDLNCLFLFSGNKEELQVRSQRMAHCTYYLHSHAAKSFVYCLV